jgi:hypothetical protein
LQLKYKSLVKLLIVFFMALTFSSYSWAKMKTHIPEPVIVKQPAGMPRYTPALNSGAPQEVSSPAAPDAGSSLPPGTLPQTLPLTHTSPNPAIEPASPPHSANEQALPQAEPPTASHKSLEASFSSPAAAGGEPSGKAGSGSEDFKTSEGQNTPPASSRGEPPTGGTTQPQAQGVQEVGNLPPPPVTQQTLGSDRGMKFLVFLVLIATVLMFWWLRQLKHRIEDLEAKVRLQDSKTALWEEVEALPLVLREALLHENKFKLFRGGLTLERGKVYGFAIKDSFLSFTTQVQLLREALADQQFALYLSARRSQAEVGSFLLSQDLAQPVYRLGLGDKQNLLKKNSKLIRSYQEKLYLIADEHCSLEDLYLQVTRLKQRGEEGIVVLDGLSVLAEAPKALEALYKIARKADLLVFIFEAQVQPEPPYIAKIFHLKVLEEGFNYAEILPTVSTSAQGRVELKVEGEEISKELKLHYATGEISV